MKPIMKFIKGNLVPVICGLAVVLGLVAWLIWPLPGMKANLQAAMKDRYDQIAAANQLVTNITLPGGQVLTGVTYEQNIIEAATKAQRSMSAQAAAIIQNAAAQNQSNRVKIVGGKTIPMLGNLPEDNYLPAIDRALGEPYGFKVDYEKQFTTWMTQLVGKDNIPGMPPAQQDMQNALTAEHARANAPIAGSAMFAGGAATGGAPDPAEFLRYQRATISHRAADIKMYVDPAALQKRDWYGRPTPPTEPQIYEGLIDCWFQQDVINAILDVNKASANVGQSPIKRLEKLTVGVAQGGSNSGMFFTSPGGAAAIVPGAAPPLDLNRTMTGRLSNAQYDVVLMNISVDLDPAYQNAFIEALYKQNNGYTVLNIITRVIDPFDSTGNGFLYGSTQVVHLEILVEGLLFRSWTLPIMPDLTKVQLGIPVTAPAVPGGAVAPPPPPPPHTPDREGLPRCRLSLRMEITVMNVKNLNPLERHVEKIVLAVAVAGALYIGYLAAQPVTVPDTDVKAGEVEQKVTEAVEHLQQVRAEVAKRTDLTPRLKDYVEEYTTIMSRQPLKPELVAATAVPQFAPLQEPIVAGADLTPTSNDMQVVTPLVPLPKNVTAVTSRATVAILSSPTPGADVPPPPTPGTPLPGTQVKDLNWVTVSGRIPMDDFKAEMNDPALQPNQKLAPAVQRAVLYRVEVQRRTRNNGTWTSWEPVAPTKANGEPITIDWTTLSDTDLVGQVALLDGAFRRIAEPDFYTSANGQPIIPAIIAKPDATTTKPARTAAPPPPVAAAPPVDIDNPSAPTAAAAAPGPGMPDIATLRQQPNIPFWFYDENVAPNQEYQYQVRLVMFNPTYRFPSGLKDPAMKIQPTIASNWLVVPATVTVNSDLYFFVDNNIGNATADNSTTKIGVRIFKWTNGNWYSTQGTAQPGMPITGSVRLFDKGNAIVDVPTGFTLVDVLASSGGGELTAVLLAPSGELVTRSSKSDGARVNTKRQQLEHDAVKPAAPPPPPPRVRTIAPAPSRGASTPPADQIP